MTRTVRPPDPRNRRYVGKPILKAIEEATARDEPWRIKVWDENYRVLTRDYNPNRANFTVESGVVTEVTWG